LKTKLDKLGKDDLVAFLCALWRVRRDAASRGVLFHKRLRMRQRGVLHTNRHRRSSRRHDLFTASTR